MSSYNLPTTFLVSLKLEFSLAKRRNANTIILHKEEDLANLSKRGGKSGQECKTDRRG